ncbi:MAG: MFS transporter [Anaerolineae bacterium]
MSDIPAPLTTDIPHIEHMDRSLNAAMVAIFVLRVASGAMGILVGLYLKSLGVPATVVGLFGAAFYVMELITSPLFGAWSDRYGRKPFMMLGPVFGGVAVLITSITASIPLLFFTRMLEGLSTASSVPSTLSYISDVSDRSAGLRGRVVSLFEIATIGGLAVGGVVGGVLWDHFGRASFAFDALIYGVSLAIFVWGVEAVRATASHTHKPMRDYLRLFQDRHVLSFVPAWLAVNAILGVWINLLPYLMSGAKNPDQNLMGGFSGSAIGAMMALLVLVFAGGILLWGLAFKRIGRVHMMLIAVFGLFLTAAAVYGLNNIDPDQTLIGAALIGALLLGVGIQSGFTPAALGYLADLSGRFIQDRGVIMGLYSVLLALGQSIGATLGGRFAHWGGIDGIILLTVLLGGVGLVCILILGRLPDEIPSPA